MANIFDVSKYILKKFNKMSTMKLQKLCYYCQVWSLVWDDEPLFDDEFQAWANGPVCADLFHFSQGEFSVTFDEMKGDINNLSSCQKDTIDKVLEYYGDKNAQWLSQLTHMEDPWKLARNNLSNEPFGDQIITKESMAIYYGGL